MTGTHGEIFTNNQNTKPHAVPVVKNRNGEMNGWDYKFPQTREKREFRILKIAKQKIATDESCPTQECDGLLRHKCLAMTKILCFPPSTGNKIYPFFAKNQMKAENRKRLTKPYILAVKSPALYSKKAYSNTRLPFLHYLSFLI